MSIGYESALLEITPDNCYTPCRNYGGAGKHVDLPSRTAYIAEVTLLGTDMPKHLAIALVFLSIGCQEANKPAPVPVRTRPTRPFVMATFPSLATIQLIQGTGDLGNADFGDTRQARFRLKNNAKTAVQLRVTDKSCTCAAVHVEEPYLAPDAETDVVLSWTPKVEALESTQIRLWAEIEEVQSQYRLRFEATGNIEPLITVAYPRGPLDFGKLSPADLDQTASQRVIEFYSRQTAFASPHSIINNPGLEVLSVDAMPEDRLLALKAKAGYRLVVRPTKKLSHGAFQAELQVKVDVKKQPLLIPLTGEFDTSTISLSQPRWQLPPKLSLKKGYKLPAITLTVRFGICTQCEVQTITPPLFTSKVQQTTNKTWRIELQLNTDVAALQKQFTPEAWKTLMEQGFEQGSVVIKLNHPEVPSITIPMNGSQLFQE